MTNFTEWLDKITGSITAAEIIAWEMGIVIITYIITKGIKYINKKTGGSGIIGLILVKIKNIRDKQIYRGIESHRYFTNLTVNALTYDYLGWFSLAFAMIADGEGKYKTIGIIAAFAGAAAVVYGRYKTGIIKEILRKEEIVRRSREGMSTRREMHRKDVEEYEDSIDLRIREIMKILEMKRMDQTWTKQSKKERKAINELEKELNELMGYRKDIFGDLARDNKK